MKQNAWVVVADSDRARILKVQKPGTLIQIDCLYDPMGRMKEHDLTSDRSGRRSSARSPTHMMEPSTYPHQKELIAFAKRLALYLEKAHQDRDYDSLYLVAQPRLLGLLRQTLSPLILNVIAGECHKNLVPEPLEAIWDQLPVVV